MPELFKNVIGWPLSENTPQKKSFSGNLCLSWLFQAFLFYYYFVSPLMQCHQTWKKSIHTKIVFWNGLFKQLSVRVNSKTKKIKKEVKRNSWNIWLRDKASKTCLFCLAFLADAVQVTWSSKMRGRVQVWQTQVNPALGLPECIWTSLWVWASTSQAFLAGKAPSNSFTLSVVPC